MHVHLFYRRYNFSLCKNITIHHECPCRIEISHRRGLNFNQGQALLSLCLNSDTGGEISLSYMDRLIMGSFSFLLPKVFCWNVKVQKIVNFLTFYLFDLHYFRVHMCFYLVLKWK